MYGKNDAVKVITIRISQAEYDKLSALVKKHHQRWYPRVTLSSMARRLIAYCLDKGIDPFG